MWPLGLMRRAGPGGFAALALTLAVAGHYAIARTAQPFPNIRVDVSPLRANSLNPTAAWVAEELPGQIAEALARRGRAQYPDSGSGRLCHSGAKPRRNPRSGRSFSGQYPGRRDDPRRGGTGEGANVVLSKRAGLRNY